jgi:hypothetical protein
MMPEMPMIIVLRRLLVLAVPATCTNAVICTWCIIAHAGSWLVVEVLLQVPACFRQLRPCTASCLEWRDSARDRDGAKQHNNANLTYNYVTIFLLQTPPPKPEALEP